MSTIGTISKTKTAKPKSANPKAAKPKSTKSKSAKPTNLSTDYEITPEIIDQFNSDPAEFILLNDSDILISLIKYAASKYYNDQAIMSDADYDFLIDTIKELDPDNEILRMIGSEVLSKNKIKLPYFMGSMDKIKPSDQNVLSKWLSRYQGPYVYSDKLDGVSGLLIFNKPNKFSLYTRGDGYEGTDISNLVKHIKTISNLNKSKLSDGIAVRGELIMSKANFTKYASRMANARNMVSGIVNSKTLDTEAAADVDFIAYEIISPWIPNQQTQFDNLKQMGFKTVCTGGVDQMLFQNFSTILQQRIASSEYEIDGIIISNTDLPKQRETDSNPTYAFAFKNPDLLARAKVKVISVRWAISKDGYIKPTLELEPTKLSGVTISSVTALHAKYVVDNKLGPGAVIELIRSGDVIPKIVKVLKPATSGEAQMPDPDIEYEWSTTGVDIITTTETDDQTIKELTHFFKKLNIPNLNEPTVKKMLAVGIDSIEQILKIKKSDLVEIDGFGQKMVDKIYTNISNRIQTLTMLDLMVASNVFGHGLGERKLRKIMESYPDIIQLYTNNESDEIINLIKQLDGFDTKTAEYFETGLENFIDLFNRLEPSMRKQLRQSIIDFEAELAEINKSDSETSTETDTDAESDTNAESETENHAKPNVSKANVSKANKKLDGMSILFSGFRNKEWEKFIVSKRGKVASSVSSKTSLVVTTAVDLAAKTNAKIVKALELKIPVITKEQFESEYINSD